MSVGDGLLVEPPPLERAIHKATLASIALAILGLATGNRLLRNTGAGGVIALQLARHWGKR